MQEGEYERERRERMEANEAELLRLGLGKLSDAMPAQAPRPSLNARAKRTVPQPILARDPVPRRRAADNARAEIAKIAAAANANDENFE